MRIQHNIAAMNSYRNYIGNSNALSKNLEKLSSGYKINRAGDDAAGLAISEKMRAQISGLDQAQNNVKDGISLVKTAEGAMQEVQDMLNRMVSLATQSANGTYQNEVDRENLQAEVEALKSEINRIADSTNFNGQKLLDGTLSTSGSSSAVTTVDVTALKDSLKAGTAAKGVYEIDLNQFKATVTNVAASATGTVNIFVGGVTVATIGTKNTAASTGSVIADKTNLKAASAAVTINGTKFSVSISSGKVTLTMAATPTAEYTGSMAVTTSGGTGNQGETLGVDVVTAPVAEAADKYAQGEFDLSKLKITDGAQLTIGQGDSAVTYTFKVGAKSEVTGSNVINLSKYEEDNANLAKYAAQELSKQSHSQFMITSKNDDTKVQLTELGIGTNVDYDVNNLSGKASVTNDGNWKGLVSFKSGSDASKDGALTLQIGDTADKHNRLEVSIDDMHTKSLGIADIDIGSRLGAQDAIETIKTAINKVSSTRGNLGAIQNRLEHTQNNLSVMAENIQDAESTIRDTDIADEMTTYTKNNILLQSAQAMLAQANQMPQGVLQLLQ